MSSKKEKVFVLINNGETSISLPHPRGGRIEVPAQGQRKITEKAAKYYAQSAFSGLNIEIRESGKESPKTETPAPVTQNGEEGGTDITENPSENGGEGGTDSGKEDGENTDGEEIVDGEENGEQSGDNTADGENGEEDDTSSVDDKDNESKEDKKDKKDKRKSKAKGKK